MPYGPLLALYGIFGGHIFANIGAWGWVVFSLMLAILKLVSQSRSALGSWNLMKKMRKALWTLEKRA